MCVCVERTPLINLSALITVQTEGIHHKIAHLQLMVHYLHTLVTVNGVKQI